MAKRAVLLSSLSAAIVAAACAGSGDDAPPTDATAGLSGAEIWARHCASCHGDAGQGAQGPSLRDWSSGKPALVSLITGRMPKTDPSLCRGDCPSKVADYILSAFTSAAACDASAPPPRRLRLLSRRELRATIADLLFPSAAGASECGQVTFRYTPSGAPKTVHVAGSFNGWASTIAKGGLAMAKEPTGGAWSAKTTLVPGSYPYKFVVDEQTWLQDPTATASAPDGFGGENSVLTVACGQTAALPFDPAAALPPDTRPEGYPFDVHGQARVITADSMDAYFGAAWAVAAAARAGSFSKLLGCNPADPACVSGWVESFGLRAFRRPLSAAEKTRYVALTEGQEPDAGVEVVLATMLSSPHFLYRSEAGEPAGTGYRLTPWETASALSYFLWGTMPDAELFAAAKAGDLGTRAAIEKQARRMLQSPRARDQVATIVAQWLGAEQVVTVEKSAVAYPGFSPELRRDLLAETRALASHVVFDGSHRFDELLTANYTFANARTAAHYGLPGVTGDALVKTSYPTDGSRAGVLGHASVLATTAHSDQSSPIRRGLFVRRNLLCETFGVPPPNAGGVPKVDPGATTRERFAQHTANEACAGCHKYIDPVGFGFERLDGVGAPRATENGKPIDATGDMLDVEGQGKGTHAKFTTLSELGKTLAGSVAAKACFVKQVRRFAHGALEPGTELCSVERAVAALDVAKGDVRELVVHLVTSDDFVLRRAP